METIQPPAKWTFRKSARSLIVLFDEIFVCSIPNEVVEQLQSEAKEPLIELNADLLEEHKRELEEARADERKKIAELVKKHLQTTRISFGRVSGTLTSNELQKYNNSVIELEYVTEQPVESKEDKR